MSRPVIALAMFLVFVVLIVQCERLSNPIVILLIGIVVNDAILLTGRPAAGHV
jgi:1,4-dihydroxy-2-naphthoate octaprenyltransferase